jgi:hypothetical protein
LDDVGMNDAVQNGYDATVLTLNDASVQLWEVKGLLYVFFAIFDHDLINESVEDLVLGLIETHKYVLNVCVVRDT